MDEREDVKPKRIVFGPWKTGRGILEKPVGRIAGLETEGGLHVDTVG